MIVSIRDRSGPDLSGLEVADHGSAFLDTPVVLVAPAPVEAALGERRLQFPVIGPGARLVEDDEVDVRDIGHQGPIQAISGALGAFGERAL